MLSFVIGFKNLVYDDFAILAIKAIQEQQELINDMQQKNEDLEKILFLLEKLIEK